MRSLLVLEPLLLLLPLLSGSSPRDEVSRVPFVESKSIASLETLVCLHAAGDDAPPPRAHLELIEVHTQKTHTPMMMYSSPRTIKGWRATGRE